MMIALKTHIFKSNNHLSINFIIHADQLMKVNFKNKAYFIMHSVAVAGSGRVFARSLIDRFAGGDSAHNEIAILA